MATPVSAKPVSTRRYTGSRATVASEIRATAATARDGHERRVIVMPLPRQRGPRGTCGSNRP